MKLYFCVGCRQVHHDDDYSEKDGDLIITNWENFIESIEKVRNSFQDKGVNNDK